ncbi:MAG TPA: AAA family ATPase [Geobacteraceae bacterium]|nr:AAA family ATPase [Geobacteraceae bacterium]
MTGTEQFIDFIRENLGYAPASGDIVPGKMIRFATSDRKGDDAGWCKLFEDMEGGVFGCWRQGITETWQACTSRTQEEQREFLSRVREAKEEAAVIEEEIRRECRKKTAELWEKGRDVETRHPYLAAKRIKPHGIKQMRESLMVPVRDTRGELHGLQFIMPDGTKRFKSGTALTGCYHAMGKPGGRILIAEGYATGATLYEVTGHAVACAFTAGNLKAVAEALKQKYPDAALVICADDDHATEGNPGLAKATEVALAVDALLAVPNFPPKRGNQDTDFNDLARLSGAKAVKSCIDQARKPAPGQSAEKTLPFRYRRLSDIEAKPIRWLWPGRIARGKVSILAGHPGLGKSQITASLAAIVTTGGQWPLDRFRCEPGNVVFFSSEDDAEDTIRPRLEAAGADLSRCFIMDAVLAGETTRSFNLDCDINRLSIMLKHIGYVALVVIDPVTAYLGNTDSHKTADVRSLLLPLGELAAKHGTAVVCVSHLSKGGSSEALMRVTGSLAFVAAARSAFLVARDPVEANRRLFLPIKNNISTDETGLAFSIEGVTISDGIETSRVVWEAGEVTVTADEAMAPQGDPEERSALEDAKEFLVNLLADGPVSSKQIRVDAEGAGFAWRTIQRAQKALDIDAYKGGMKEGWLWMLPSKSAKKDEDSQEKNVAPFGNLGALRRDNEVTCSS